MKKTVIKGSIIIINIIMMFLMTSSIISAQVKNDAKVNGPPSSHAVPPGTDNKSSHLVDGKINYMPGEALVKFKKGVSQANRRNFHAQANAKLISTIKKLVVDRVKSETGESTEALLRRYRKNPQVEYAEPNGIFRTQQMPNDPSYSSLWGMEKIGAPEAWDRQTGSSAIIVADIDTGVDYTHEDLAANIWTNPDEIPGNGIDDDGNGYIDDIRGWDFVNYDNDPMDDHGHGTHTSGTIGAVGNNGIGVVGVNWQVQIMPVKAIGSDGRGTWYAAANAILYASSMGARVSNNSYGCTGPDCFSFTVQGALETAHDRGMLSVFSAGNANNDNDNNLLSYPCNDELSSVLCVAATTRWYDKLSSFSNYGATSVDLGAPGESILSTVPVTGNYCCSDQSGYKSLQGTSMAAPHVTGSAALMLSEHPDLNVEELKSAITGSTIDAVLLEGKTVTGGQLNINNVVNSNFIITVATTNETIPASQNTTATVTIKYLNGYGAPVDLSFVSSDQKITGNFTPSTVSPQSTSSTMTITTADGVVAGKHALKVVGLAQDGTGESHTGIFFLTVQTDLNIVELSGPARGEIGQQITVSGVIENLGSGDTDRFYVNYYLSTDTAISTYDIPIGGGWVDSISGGRQVETITDLWIPVWNHPQVQYPPISPGLYYIGAIVDNEERVPDSERANNVISGGMLEIIAENRVQPDWEAMNDPSFDNLDARKVAIDQAGNVFVGGIYSDPYVTGDADYFFTKYDPNGNQLWMRSYDNGGTDLLNAIELDEAGNLYVCGRSHNGTDYDYATMKYDTNGNQLWEARYDSRGGDDRDYGMALDMFGNLYVSGSGGLVKYNASGRKVWVKESYGHGTITVDQSGNIYEISSTSIRKYNSAGKELWYTHLPGSHLFSHSIKDVDLGPSGDIYVSGHIGIDLTIFTSRIDSNGNVLWETLYDDLNGDWSEVFIAVDKSGGVFVAASVRHLVNRDYLTIKYDSNGNQLWEARYDNGASDTVHDMEIDEYDNVYVSGASCNNYSVSGSCWGNMDSGYGGTDYVTIKYDVNGNPLWVSRYDPDLSDSPSDLNLDAEGKLYLIGSLQEKIPSLAKFTPVDTLYSGPSAPAGPVTGYPDDLLTYSTSATDPEGDPLKYLFNWGDGTSSTTAFMPSGQTASISHSWDATGSYYVKIRSIDQNNNASGWSAPLMVNITDNPTPSAPTLTGAPSGYVGLPLNYTAVTTDLQGDSVKYIFDWDDGTTTETGFTASDQPVSENHRWNSAGTYAVKVQAVDVNNNYSLWSDPLSVVLTIPPLPVSPENLSASENRGKGSFYHDLSWNDVSVAAEYQIYRGITNSGPWNLLDTATSSNYSYMVDSSTQYYYVVTAVNAGGESDYSNWAGSDGSSGSTGPVPLAITTLSLPDGYINLYYEQALQAEGGSTPYSWSLVSGILPSGLSMEPATGVISGTPTTEESQLLTVQVMDSLGDTSNQTLSINIEAEPSGPDAPSGLTSTVVKRGKKYKVQLGWDANLPAPVNYRVYRSQTSGADYVQLGEVAGDTNSYTDSNVTAGQTYYYVITAVSGSESAYSAETIIIVQ